MKIINKYLSLIAITIVMIGLVGVSTAVAKTLKFAHVYEVGHPLHAGALRAAALLEERTNGRHKIKVFPASSLGKEADLNESLSLGTIDIIYTGAGFSGSIYGPISISDFPFTLRNLKHWEAYINSGLFEELSDGYSKAARGNTITAVSYYGSRHVTSNKPILKPNDMAGLKIRVPNAPAYILFPKAVGANPTPMAFSEVYLALQQGVVDAQENPLPTIQAKKFHEVQSNINLTGHITNSTFTIVSGNLLKQF
jgi:tripartite ATP-independent transporter DctP family solute receptor